MPRLIKNKTQLIRDRAKRIVTFSRLKKDLIKKAIEITSMCQQKAVVVLYDDKKHKMVYYSSTSEFTLAEAHRAR